MQLGLTATPKRQDNVDTYEYFGEPVYAVNGDGLDDLIVGAFRADSSGKSDAGKSYVIFGKKDSTAIDLSAIGT